MPRPATLLLAGDTTLLNQTGEAQRAAGYYSTAINGGWHTVSADLVNFTGRVYIEATLSANPTDSDWFPIQLTSTTAYAQFPVMPLQPTDVNGDTVTVGWTFRGNFVFARARIDRSYIAPPPNDLSTVGVARKIMMSV